MVFEIACHHLIETFSSVFSQGTTYLVYSTHAWFNSTCYHSPGHAPRNDFFPTGQSIPRPRAQQYLVLGA